MPATPEPGLFTGLGLDDLLHQSDPYKAKKSGQLSSAKSLLASARKDQILRIHGKQVYVTCSAGTSQQLSQFFSILRHAAPEYWYTADEEQPMSSGPLEPTYGVPCASVIPKICIDTPLSSDDTTEPEANCAEESIGKCRTMRYLSIVAAAPSGAKNASFSHNLGYGPVQSRSEASLSLYKLVVTGSAAKAREEAVWNALAHGWSTVFTVVVHDKGMVGHAVKDLGLDSIRVKSLADLTCKQKEQGSRKVFF